MHFPESRFGWDALIMLIMAEVSFATGHRNPDLATRESRAVKEQETASKPASLGENRNAARASHCVHLYMTRITPVI
jgi:hypothetical protein